MARIDILERKDEILQWISENESNAEIARRLSCKVDTLKSYYKKLGIEYIGNQGLKSKRTDPKRLDALELIKSPSVANSRKRIRLIEDGYKENKCERCNNSIWMNMPIPLELHHKDFNHYNNELDNLMIVCSNCHGQLHNYSNHKG